MKKTGPGHEIDATLDVAEQTIAPLAAGQKKAIRRLATANKGVHYVTLNVQTGDGTHVRFGVHGGKSWLVSRSGKTTAE